jgi:hypothetical protein
MLKCRTYRLNKEIGRRSEDAFACNRTIGRFALSDGASTSYAGRAWARAPCWQFMRDPDCGGDWLSAARIRFLNSVAIPSDDWSAAMAFDRGSFATFLGFTVLADRISGYAVGDTVLFVLDPDGYVRWWPSFSPEDFHRDPILLASQQGLSLFLETEEDFWKAQIDFAVKPDSPPLVKVIAATDAIAAWVMGNGDNGAIYSRLKALVNLTSNGQFGDFVQQEKAAGSLKIDDYTVMIIEP